MTGELVFSPGYMMTLFNHPYGKTLIAGANVLAPCAVLVDPLGDVGRLLVERDQDRDVVAVVAVVTVVVADLANRLADQFGDIEMDAG